MTTDAKFVHLSDKKGNGMSNTVSVTEFAVRDEWDVRDGEIRKWLDEIDGEICEWLKEIEGEVSEWLKEIDGRRDPRAEGQLQEHQLRHTNIEPPTRAGYRG